MMLYMKIKIFVFAMSCFTLTAFGQGGNSIEKRIDELVSQMTLQEKIGQMNQLTGMGLSKNMKESVKTGKVGTILNELNVEVVNELQRIAVEESRLHIPLIVARDVIHGFKTIFPIPLGQAASWNPEVAEEGARVAAMEASATGIRWTFAPMIDVSRDPRWGRIAEWRRPLPDFYDGSSDGERVSGDRFISSHKYRCLCQTLCGLWSIRIR